MELPASKRTVRLQRLGVYLMWLIILVKLYATLWLELRLTIWYPWNVFKALFQPRHWLHTLGFIALQAPIAVLHSTLVLTNEPPPLALPRGISEACSRLQTIFVKRMPLSLIQLFWTPAAQQVHIQVPSILQRVWHTRPHFSQPHVSNTFSSWQQAMKVLLLVAAITFSGINFIPLFDYLYSDGRGESLYHCSAAITIPSLAASTQRRCILQVV